MKEWMIILQMITFRVLDCFRCNVNVSWKELIWRRYFGSSKHRCTLSCQKREQFARSKQKLYIYAHIYTHIHTCADSACMYIYKIICSSISKQANMNWIEPMYWGWGGYKGLPRNWVHHAILQIGCQIKLIFTKPMKVIQKKKRASCSGVNLHANTHNIYMYTSSHWNRFSTLHKRVNKLVGQKIRSARNQATHGKWHLCAHSAHNANNNIQYMYMHRKNVSTLIKKFIKAPCAAGLQWHEALPEASARIRVFAGACVWMAEAILWEGLVLDINDKHTVQTRARVNEWI